MNRSVIAAILAALAVGIVSGYVIASRNTQHNPAKSGTSSVSSNTVAKKNRNGGGKPAEYNMSAGYSLTPEIIDLGRLREGQALKRTVALSHPGTGDVRIGRIYTSCPCVSVTAEKMIVPASEVTRLTVNFHSLTTHGKETKYYYVELLKPERVKLRGTVKANVKRVPSKIVVEPSVLHFGSVFEKKQQTFKVWNLTRRSIRITLKNAGGLTSNQLDKPLTAKSGKAVELTVTANSATLKAGSLRGKLRLSTSLDLHHEVSVPFDGAVRK